VNTPDINKHNLIAAMFEAGVQYGHKSRFSNPAMSKYVYQTTNKMRLIDVRQSEERFLQALEFIKQIVAKKGQVLFVGTKVKASSLIKKYAASCNMPYIDKRWLGGTLTNYMVVSRSVKKLEALTEERQTNDFSYMIKKERAKALHLLTNLERKVGGIRTMRGLPAAIFMIDTKSESNAIREAQVMGIPVIAVVDTNSSPLGVTHVIPGNDDSMKAIKLYLSYLAEAINACSPSAPAEKVEETTSEQTL
jgi:small subunit ribosomal protein S2